MIILCNYVRCILWFLRVRAEQESKKKYTKTNIQNKPKYSFSQPPRCTVKIVIISVNLLGLGKLGGRDGFPNTSLVLVEHGYNVSFYWDPPCLDDLTTGVPIQIFQRVDNWRPNNDWNQRETQSTPIQRRKLEDSLSDTICIVIFKMSAFSEIFWEEYSLAN